MAEGPAGVFARQHEAFVCPPGRERRLCCTLFRRVLAGGAANRPLFRAPGILPHSAGFSAVSSPFCFSFATEKLQLTNINDCQSLILVICSDKK